MLTSQFVNSQADYEQGSLLANQQRYLEALACFDRAIAQQPEDCAAWIFRGVMLIYLGRFDEALKSCDRALAIQPKNAEAWLFHGVALQRLGRYREAYQNYDHALGRWHRPLTASLMRGLKRVWQLLAGFSLAQNAPSNSSR